MDFRLGGSFRGSIDYDITVCFACVVVVPLALTLQDAFPLGALTQNLAGHTTALAGHDVVVSLSMPWRTSG